MLVLVSNNCLQFTVQIAPVCVTIARDDAWRFVLAISFFSWEWTAQTDKAFKTLKGKLAGLPEIAFPDSKLPYELHTDASNVGIGAALVQQGRPIAFSSRTLTSAERNYSTTEKECLAIVWAIGNFHPYVHGAQLTV
jgi:hypothetical protein